MTRDPAHPISTKGVAAKVDAAVLVLVRLIADQAARELAVSAPDQEDAGHGAEDQL
ncbi:MAG: hypothetical protein RSE12_00330 [Fuscovulum sp.]|nr:MAG: hypothetical protein RSE12_00330 [Fuscovulum sp.]